MFLNGADDLTSNMHRFYFRTFKSEIWTGDNWSAPPCGSCRACHFVQLTFQTTKEKWNIFFDHLLIWICAIFNCLKRNENFFFNLALNNKVDEFQNSRCVLWFVQFKKFGKNWSFVRCRKKKMSMKQNTITRVKQRTSPRRAQLWTVTDVFVEWMALIIVTLEALVHISQLHLGSLMLVEMGVVLSCDSGDN